MKERELKERHLIDQNTNNRLSAGGVRRKKLLRQ